MPLRGADFKGFPFDEEEGPDGGGAWSELAARHPDIAARLRARPSGWARKRRSSHNSPASTTAAPEGDDFVSGLGEHFNRFPFDDIPPEFREHFPGHWGHRFVPQERTAAAEQHPPAQQPPRPQPQQNKPPQNTISTQTEDSPSLCVAGPTELKPEPSGSLPQYGLRNTVDLGQKTPADPSLVDAENERNQRSMSAPPDNRVPTPNQHSMGNMMGGNPPPPPPPQQHDHHEHNAQSNVRHIPIFVEGRDEPIINKAHPEPAASYTEPKPQYAPPPSEREQYFEREPHMGFPHPPPNFSRAFGTPFGKGFRQGPQPFAPQKTYQQSAAPQGQSPPQQHFTQIPVHHTNVPPPQQQQHQQPQRQQSPQPPPPPHQAPPQQQAPPPEPSLANDPISKILNIQKDVLDLMTEVENFVGTKKDKRYIYLDEMLTRNLIKLDDIETEGKENIRQARREAIKCIQKCIAVLEAKADGKIPTTPQPSNVDMTLEQNGQVESTEPATSSETKEVPSVDSQPAENSDPSETAAEATDEAKGTPDDVKETTDDSKGTPKKTKKVVKKRDKSKDKTEGGESEPSKVDNVEGREKGSDVNVQGDRAQPMETEASAVSSQ